MKIYDLIKDRLKDPQGVISDNEIFALNRRDFLYSETSVTRAFLSMFNAERVSYEMYAIIDFLHASLCKLDKDSEINVFQLSNSMTLPALAVSVFLGDGVRNIAIAAPRGGQKVKPKDELAKQLLGRFERQIQSKLTMSDLGSVPENRVQILICNASNEAEVISGIKAFEKVRRGILLIKGYGRHGAPNCGEVMLEARLNIHSTVSGFGFCIAI